MLQLKIPNSFVLSNFDSCATMKLPDFPTLLKLTDFPTLLKFLTSNL